MNDASIKVLRSPLYWAIVILACAPAGYYIGQSARGAHDALAFVKLGLLSASFLMVASGVIGAVVSWRLVDEAQQEAHKWGWFWGGGIASLLSAAILGFIAVQGIALPSNLQCEPGVMLAIGMLATLVIQTIGQLIGVSSWWLARR